MSHTARRILLIEQEYPRRLALKSALKAAGFEPCGEAAGADEAAELARNLHPDAVLMGGEAGKRGLQQLRELASLQIAPLIYLSPAPEQAAEAAKAGAYAVLPRMAEAELILPALEVACARFAERQALRRETEDLRDLLALRKTLDQAKGILMRQYHMSEQEAHRRIQRYAMHKRLTVKSVAEAIVKATGGKANK